MPHLRYLTMKSTNIYLNGYEWETIILDYLPNLQLFRVKMKFIVSHQNYIEQEINQLIQTFQTPFWIEKHQWFVRCYSTMRNQLKIAVLHTLPYTFEELHVVDEDYYQSTCPNDKNYSSYNDVQNLHLEKYNNETFSQSYTRLPNIRCLSIRLPFDDNLWSCISSLNQLISLYVIIPYEHFHYSQLQFLRERAFCLYSLKFRDSLNLDNALFLSKATSIRRLNFLETECYDRESCMIFANSSLGQQCEVLLIEVENREGVLFLVDNSSNVRWDDTDFEIPSKNNEMFAWLQNNLPSTYLFMRDSDLASSYIRLWTG